MSKENGKKKDKDKSARKRSKVSFESELDRSEAIAYLEALVAGLKQGVVHFRRGEKNLIMRPTDDVEIEVEARRKGDKEKISFELAWEAAPELAAPPEDEGEETTESYEAALETRTPVPTTAASEVAPRNEEPHGLRISSS